jgi:hypothetical protein
MENTKDKKTGPTRGPESKQGGFTSRRKVSKDDVSSVDGIIGI